jgi:flagellar hook protein FlgE
MLANSNWLSTISQNVANANSTGYKDVDTAFSALVDQSAGSNSVGAGVATTTQSMNSLQGQVESTSTSTDLAVQGAGFFVVSNASGDTFLTRNGSFVPDASGNLVNAAGYYLMGANTQGSSSTVSVNSIASLQKVNIQGAADSAAPSTTANLVANLPSASTVVVPAAGPPAVTLPSSNVAGATYTAETTVVAYDDLGAAHTINLYFTNTGPNGTGGDTWEVDAFDSSAAATTGGPFPYTGGALATANLTFDSTTGALLSGSPQSLSIPVPGGQSLSLNLAQTTQLATGFAVNSSTINGNSPGSLSGVTINSAGILSFQYGNGASQNAYVIPLANVPSPDNLTSAIGDAYQVSNASGPLQVGNAQSGGLGSVDSSSLEQSTVDLATELTSMVEAQSSYEANSKVFQTGADILSILNNLKA